MEVGRRKPVRVVVRMARKHRAAQATELISGWPDIRPVATHPITASAAAAR